MKFLDLAKERYSVRKFDKRKVEQEKIDSILEAGKLAPTACNYQPQRVILIQSQDGLERVKDCTRYHFDAPLTLIICYDSTVSWKRSFDNYDMGAVDAGIVATHMILEIAELGLGSTWVGHFDPQKVKENFSLPENIIPVAILPIGYPAEESSPNPNHTKRQKLEIIKF